MKLKIFLAIFFISVILVGCGQDGTNNEVSLKESKVENIKELVRDYSLGNIENGSASITSQQLIVKKKDGSEVVYDLSEGDFFVSIAPYINETHP